MRAGEEEEGVCRRARPVRNRRLMCNAKGVNGPDRGSE